MRRCQYSYSELEEVCVGLRNEDWELGEVDERGRPAINGFGPDQEVGMVRVRVQSGRPDVSARLVSKYGSRIAVEEGDWEFVAFV